MNKKVITTISGIIIVGAVSWLVITNNHNAPKQTERQTQSERAPDFSLQDYNRKTVGLIDFSGQPLVINTWASWCPFCNKELFDLSAIQQELKDQVVIIAINRAEPAASAKKFLEDSEISQTLIYLDDPNDSFYQSIGGFAMPETIFVDKDGFIRDHKRGPMDLDEIRARIQKIL